MARGNVRRNNYGRNTNNRRHSGNSGRRSNNKNSYDKRILQLTRDLCHIEQGLKDSDTKVHEVFNETLARHLDGPKKKKPLY